MKRSLIFIWLVILCLKISNDFDEGFDRGDGVQNEQPCAPSEEDDSDRIESLPLNAELGVPKNLGECEWRNAQDYENDPCGLKIPG